MATNTLTNVQVATNASVALITPLTATSSLKVVNLPTWSPGKFVYVADSNGNAGSYPFGIGTTGPSTIIVGAIRRNLNYFSSVVTSSFSAVVNRNYGAMGFVAGGTVATTSATQIYYTVINEGGSQSATYFSTNVLDVGTINTQNLNFVGAGAVGFTSLNVANLTTSNTIQAIGGISTTTISTASAYIGALTIGSASDLGGFAVFGTISSGGLTITSGPTSVAALTVTAGATISGGLLTTVNISNAGYNCNGSIGYFGGLLTAAAGATVSGGLLTTANISNTGYNCNGGVGHFGGLLNAAGSISTGGISTGSIFSGGASIDATSTNIISSGSIYAGSFFYSVASY